MLALALLTAAAMLAPATEVRRIAAPDANQGVASDGRFVYAVGNHVLARIEIASGKTVARWEGDAARFPHMNSCVVDGAALVCAASNYPDVPMASRIERFDARSLRHLGTQELASGDGSLTWAMRRDGGWYACFANYDGHGGTPGRDHSFTTLVRYDREWHAQAQWRFPASVLERMTPRSASGGSWGADGLLYVSGHDRPELYVMRVPAGGGILEHVATIPMPTGGQAIDWDPSGHRLLWSIERDGASLVESRIPAVR
ncbi:hypothetical protein [Sphingomonas nostoxanthinifaciens]|uniref:hypothetical protein n=1 Tax=Sphingomonas nostoxanthinifaciens TaxID=2872652 RepID=UPI001CC1F83D|nr:hypothetical protein [Sphingomonas nostoxanthinifaciens]UAK24541.1 hypothetical protein K8P63_19925 [Sphingomonas nostoxanthinifaciens]